MVSSSQAVKLLACRLQMGNSEVGHLTIGSGRVIYQNLTRITRAIKDGSFEQNTVLLEAMNKAKETGHKFHVMGLLSDGASTAIWIICWACCA